jgi:hypothetical protein
VTTVSATGADVTAAGWAGADTIGAAPCANDIDELPISAAMIAVLPVMFSLCALVIFILLSFWTRGERLVAGNWSLPCGAQNVVGVERSKINRYSFAVQQNQTLLAANLENADNG